jgi:outer membrane protein, protease secretion system
VRDLKHALTARAVLAACALSGVVSASAQTNAPAAPPVSAPVPASVPAPTHTPVSASTTPPPPSTLPALPSAAAADAAVRAVAGPPLSYAQAFDLALAHDPQFRSARYEREMTRQNVPIARSALLPSLGLTASHQSVNGQRSFPNSLNQQVTLEVEYTVPNQGLQLRAPIFNWESVQRYRTALIQNDAAEALLRVRATELVERLTLAYVQRLLAEENIGLLDAQIAVVRAQRDRAQQRLERGEGTRIELADLEAQLEVARARMIEVTDQAQLARRALARLTGQDAPQLQGLPAGFVAPPLVPLELEEWVQLGMQRNPAVQTRHKQVEVAKSSIQRAKAGHYPRLEAVGSITRGSNDSVNQLGQSNRLTSVGLQLAIPIFSGFGVQAAVDQAGFELAKAEADLDNERANVRQEIERQFIAASAGRKRALALEQSAAALELSAEGVRRNQLAGLRTVSEVLEAQARVLSARRDTAQARLEYLTARMRLAAQSGAPLADVVMDLQRLLEAPR